MMDGTFRSVVQPVSSDISPAETFKIGRDLPRPDPEQLASVTAAHKV